jgi:DNA-binding NtrC family response regulator
MQRAMHLVAQFAATPIAVLLVGPTGSGKELLARRLHRLSGRPGLLIDVNCAALPPDIAESELFGHCRGAFTHATSDTDGLVRAARGGTLFLDELTSLPLAVQAKLLRVLENREVRRVGATAGQSVDFRLISACHTQIGQDVADGRFRADLFHRVSGVRIDIPALARRPADVAPLATHFASRIGRELSAEALDLVERHPWPGNVRELRAAIERAAVLTPAEITRSDMAESISLGGDRTHHEPQPGASPPSGQRWLYSVCAANGWEADRIATALGVHRSTLFRWLRRFGITLRRTVDARALSAVNPDQGEPGS